MYRFNCPCNIPHLTTNRRRRRDIHVLHRPPTIKHIPHRQRRGLTLPPTPFQLCEQLPFRPFGQLINIHTTRSTLHLSLRHRIRIRQRHKLGAVHQIITGFTLDFGGLSSSGVAACGPGGPGIAGFERGDLCVYEWD